MNSYDQDTEWTPVEIDSLKAALGDGLSVKETAEVLERSLDEVIQKCRELDL
jgi:hypothetical protein